MRTTCPSRFALIPLLAVLLMLGSCGKTPKDPSAFIIPMRPEPAEPATPGQVIEGLARFYRETARPDGSFQPGVDPEYLGMSDSASSDMAAVTYACTVNKTFGLPLPYEEKTVAFLLARQRPSGDFFNVAGTVDPESAEGRTYNTTQGLVALHALGVKPKFDPLPVFEEILKGDYKTLPAYSTSFFPLAYLCYGRPIPPKADRGIRALMVQDETGYTNDHVAATFHASHYYALVGEPTPKSREMVDRILRDQRPDGSWLLNMPSRDRHATFDAVFTLLHEGDGRKDCRLAIDRAARWALSCRNADGGFGHYPGSASDADAVYFQVGTLVMAGYLRPVQPLPTDPHLLSWGHLMPVRRAQGTDAPVKLALPGWVGGVAISPDGRTLATACSDGRARLGDVISGITLRTLEGHADVVSAVAFAPDERWVATASYDRTAKVWDPRSGNLLHTLGGHRGAVLSVAFSPKGNLLATAGVDRTIQLWDARTGESVRTLVGHKSWVNSVAFDSTGKTLVSGSSDGTVKLWDVSTGECRRTFAVTKAEVRCVAMSPDGTTIAAGLRYGSVKIWKADDQAGPTTQPTIRGLAGDVWAVGFTPSGELVTGSGDWNQPGQVTFWDAATRRQIRQLTHTGEVLSLAISPADGRVAAGGGDRTVSIWQRP